MEEKHANNPNRLFISWNKLISNNMDKHQELEDKNYSCDDAKDS